jgi:uncharacterized membrane protein (DUF106 family)
MNMQEIQAVAAQLQKDTQAAYNDGVQYALEYLSDLYEGIEETDIWASYMTEKEAE